MRSSIPLLLLLLLPASARAQRFSEVARDAEDLSAAPSTLVGPFVRECDEGPRHVRRQCSHDTRLAVRELRRKRYLWSVPAAGHLEVGPYEHVTEGFRIRVPGFALVDGPALVATQALEGGELPKHTLAESFRMVEPANADQWHARNAIGRLRMRLVVGFGEIFEDAGRSGVILEVHAVQVYNGSSGEVLLDSAAPREEIPPAPPELTERVVLWDRSQLLETLWHAPDGTPILLSVRADPIAGHPEALRPVLLRQTGIEQRELVRFTADRPDASVAVSPHGPGVLVVFTKSRPGPDQPGHGEVHLFHWRPAAGDFVEAARWEGSNSETPPPWVLDPAAPLRP